jgi:hypothetical protein
MAEEGTMDFDRYIDVVAPAVGLHIPDQYRAQALELLRLAAAVAQPLMEFELDQSIEPATTFSPPGSKP